MKLIALATFHNRKSLTLRALKSLQQQSLPQDCEMSICLVDDGSTDGTAQAVQEQFPDVVMLTGSGDLFWAGGMRYGWDNYVKQQEFDHLVVFNDDVELYPNALQLLISAVTELESESCSSFAVAGAFKNPDTGALAYGGVVRRNRWHPLQFRKIEPADTLRECATVNMNLTLISHAALNDIGFLAPEFVHKTADYDFGLRLRKAGGRIVLAAGYVGECAVNPVPGTVYEPGVGLAERLRRVSSLKGQPLRLRAIYYRRHGGIFWPFFWCLSYIRILYVSGLEAVKSLRPEKQRH